MPLHAQEITLPRPGVMVNLSPAFDPPVLKGIRLDPRNPLRFDFILDKGSSSLSDDALKDESITLIKYFLASLTVPEKDLWVNLSPYEKDRIIPESFGQTGMGRDLLAQDYILKQVTASLIYPEGETGREFWKRVYAQTAGKFGAVDIPVDTFNKVWIVPDKAVVYENAAAGTAYVTQSTLKVMLEEDYLASEKNKAVREGPAALAKIVLQEIVIPQLAKEINEGRNFAQLRQIYQSLILAAWYKRKIKDGILKQVYVGRNKVAGVNIDDPQEKQKIYERYLQAFKKGVYNYIKEEPDPVTRQVIPRKYFSGGAFFGDFAMTVTEDARQLPGQTRGSVVTAEVFPLAGPGGRDQAMAAAKTKDEIRAEEAKLKAELDKGPHTARTLAEATGIDYDTVRNRVRWSGLADHPNFRKEVKTTTKKESQAVQARLEAKLNEGPHTPSQLAQATGLPILVVRSHLRAPKLGDHENLLPAYKTAEEIQAEVAAIKAALDAGPKTPKQLAEAIPMDIEVIWERLSHPDLKDHPNLRMLEKKRRTKEETRADRTALKEFLDDGPHTAQELSARTGIGIMTVRNDLALDPELKYHRNRFSRPVPGAEVQKQRRAWKRKLLSGHKSSKETVEWLLDQKVAGKIPLFTHRHMDKILLAGRSLVEIQGLAAYLREKKGVFFNGYHMGRILSSNADAQDIRRLVEFLEKEPELNGSDISAIIDSKGSVEDKMALVAFLLEQKDVYSRKLFNGGDIVKIMSAQMQLKEKQKWLSYFLGQKTKLGDRMLNGRDIAVAISHFKDFKASVFDPLLAIFRDAGVEDKIALYWTLYMPEYKGVLRRWAKNDVKDLSDRTRKMIFPLFLRRQQGRDKEFALTQFNGRHFDALLKIFFPVEEVRTVKAQIDMRMERSRLLFNGLARRPVTEKDEALIKELMLSPDLYVRGLTMENLSLALPGYDLTRIYVDQEEGNLETEADQDRVRVEVMVFGKMGMVMGRNILDALAAALRKQNVSQRAFLYTMDTVERGQAMVRVNGHQIDGREIPVYHLEEGDMVELEDNAQLARSPEGGINFDPGQIEFETGTTGTPVNVDPVVFKQLENVPGFFPVIINIKPVNDLRLFLGIKK